MSLSSLIWGQSQFDEAVEKATSELRLAQDIALNLEICDQIRSKSVSPKDAARALKKRLNHKNPNVQLLTLTLLDVCVKNGGDHLLCEVASKEFMDNLVSILKIPNLNPLVKDQALRLIQNWSVAFEGKHTLGYVSQVYKALKSDGFDFPPKDMTVANSAMVDTSTAPDWIDSDVCLRCRTAFTFTNRKHHCRNCGQVFDQQCSSKTLPLPHFGIAQEVRVCDGCFAKLTKMTRSKERTQSVDFNSGNHRLSASSRAHKHRSAQDFVDADLQRAIQLSLAESAPNSSYETSNASRPSHDQWQRSEPPLVDRGTYAKINGSWKEEDDDPDLKAAIEASLREANAPRPSAPVETSLDESESYAYYRTNTRIRAGDEEIAPPRQPPLPVLPNHDLNPRESDAILTFNQTIQDAHAQGSSALTRIANVHEMYDRANGLRPKLALSLDDTGRKEQMLSEMHEKLSQAVKLYDQLLTEQISHPTWRTPSASQQPHPRIPARHETYHGSQHLEVSDRSLQNVSFSPPVEQNYRTVGSHPVVGPPTSLQPRPAIQRQPSLPLEYGTSNAHVQSQPSFHAVESHQHTLTPMPSGSAYNDSYPQQQKAWPQMTNAEVSTSPPQQMHQPPNNTHEHWPQGQQYQIQHSDMGQGLHPSKHEYQPHSYPQPTSTSPILVRQQYPTVQPQPLAQAPVPVNQQQQTQPVHSPPPAQSYSQPAFPGILSRHNTISHAPTSPVSLSSVALGRSNTIASHSQPQNAYASASVNSTSFPVFPTAPTSNPQMYPMYSPPVTGLEQTEKKEAALIDL